MMFSCFTKFFKVTKAYTCTITETIKVVTGNYFPKNTSRKATLHIHVPVDIAASFINCYKIIFSN